MGGQDDLFLTQNRQLGEQIGENLPIRLRGCVANRIGQIDGRGAGLSGGVGDFFEKLQFRSAGVLRGELDVIRVLARLMDRLDAQLDDRFFSLLELMVAMDFGSGAEDVDSRLSRMFHRLPGPRDVLWRAAGQAADDAARQLRRDRANGFEISLRADRKARLDDIDTHRFEMTGDLQFFRQRESRARGLLAVSQGRIENPNGFHDMAPQFSFTLRS